MAALSTGHMMLGAVAMVSVSIARFSVVLNDFSFPSYSLLEVHRIPKSFTVKQMLVDCWHSWNRRSAWLA